MSLDFDNSSYTGMLLAAMPGIRDTTFRGAVILICAHSAEGAMGLIVNRLATGKAVKRATDHAPDVVHTLATQVPIHAGGPAETARPFVLHSAEWSAGGDTLKIDEGHALSATPRALAHVAAGRCPARTLVALGYAGWGPGQLESELMSNVWLTAGADPAITFRQDVDAKWAAAVRAVGGQPEALSGSLGRA